MDTFYATDQSPPSPPVSPPLVSSLPFMLQTIRQLFSIPSLSKAHAIKTKSVKNRVYAREIVNLYKSKNEVETFKGNTGSDLLSGMSGVYSGDARNSGALDPNIRGVQGQGWIPVTIDGMEQAITVWRGYAGANKGNYVDPNIISSVSIEKALRSAVI